MPSHQPDIPRPAASRRALFDSSYFAFLRVLYLSLASLCLPWHLNFVLASQSYYAGYLAWCQLLARRLGFQSY